MKTVPKWRFNEMFQVGTDYAQRAEAERWDARRAKMGDVDGENRRLVEALKLGPGVRVLDMGAGTGTFAVAAAQVGAVVTAVDVSQAMLAVAVDKAARAGVARVAFHRGGFLTYEHDGAPFDVAVSSMALHHLPDFWKLVGLRRLARMLRPGGLFYLNDVVFSCEADAHAREMDAFVQGYAEKVGDPEGAEAARHIREEYSTLGWIMEGLLRQAGFRIESLRCATPAFAEYRCIREPEAD